MSALGAAGLGAGATLIDLQFMDVPGTIASYVFDVGDGLAVVDTGPSTALSALERGLSKWGADLSDVRHLLLTHIHLDHAGAAGSILARVPQAKVYVHRRGAAHLADPARLLASATQIYGDQMERLWGEMQPIAPERMVILDGGEVLPFVGLPGGVRAIYTPGHAVHHLAYHAGDDLYVGDVGGVRLAQAQAAQPPTPPPDIDVAAWERSIDVLRQIDTRFIHLAHFGSYVQSSSHWDKLTANLHTNLARVAGRLAAGEDLETITRAFAAEIDADLQFGETESAQPTLAERFTLTCPPWMSVQGLARYAQRQARV